MITAIPAIGDAELARVLVGSGTDLAAWLATSGGCWPLVAKKPSKLDLIRAAIAQVDDDQSLVQLEVQVGGQP